MGFSTLRTKGRNGPLIYLDHNATTPVAEWVRDQLGTWAECWGNPSSIHQAGRAPKTLLRESREQVAKMLGVSPLELVFTSGGSESNNLAIKGIFESLQQPNTFAKLFRNHYLFSDVEHPSVKKTAEYLKSRGARVEFIAVARDGSIDLDAYRAQLCAETALVSVMLANNETGTVFPVREMARLAHEAGALFHSDCVQALGKIPLDLRELGVDLASFAGHKFYALKGTGVLYVRRGLALESLIHGGGQERGRRGGTENLLAIASLGAMCSLKDEVPTQALRMKTLRDQMEERIKLEIHGVTVSGAENPRLPNTSSLVIAGVDGESLLMNLDMRGFAVSTGAACSSGSPEPSPVLLAMGLSRREAQSSLRVGIGWETTQEEIDSFVAALIDVVAHLRKLMCESDEFEGECALQTQVKNPLSEQISQQDRHEHS